MANEKGLPVAILTKLFEAQAEHLAKVKAINEEIAELLNGGEGIGPQMKICTSAFDVAWSARYAGGRYGSYAWRRPQDHAQMKRLIKLLGVKELVARMANYIASDDAFYVRNRHTFGLFVSSVNSWVGAPKALEDDAPVVADCRHEPRCSSDVAHTRRRSAELRA